MKVELTGLDDVLKILHPRAYQKALNRTVNDIGSRVKTQTTKEVRKTYNIKAAEIKNHITVRRSRYSNMQYVMDVRSKRRNAIHFGSKILKKKGYATVRIKKENGRSKLRNTFLSKDKKALLHRVGKTQKIKAVQTVSVSQMFNKKILEEADQMVKNEFGNKLKNNFDFYISKV
ncbi:hypothetical protein CPG37_04515 [Malaciobacter canalis]|uniref:Phage tail protein n=1 Tax=Malaciobacter canalis TaxID=1912871 RepID=A0ABX4LRU6_9BACT|nr:hypothetical protein [Malaciobacter canalis]PHO10315.1 hypothetical protein CPG37_04515 [Malaciobacter canalis]QEE32420.1 hypothetical protein ACAN_0931 [Malaciobacter canalis]